MDTTTIRERVSRLAGLFAREREALAEFISELADFDASCAWEQLGYPSLFEFLTRELRLSRGNAFYRTKAVGLVRQFPQVLEALRQGKLCISTTPEIARVLTSANVAEVLPRFFYLSRDDAKLLSVELAPRRVVPVREVVTAVGRPVAVEQACPASPPLELAPAPVEPATAAPSRVQLLNDDAPKALDRTSQSAAVLEPEIIEPLNGKLSRVHLSVTREVAAKIKAAQLALSHKNPHATIADLLELGADTALAQDANRKGLVKNPRPRREEALTIPSGSDHVPAEIRREVWKRDHGCCTWKLANGEVCGSRYRLQYDHIQPKAKGGATTIANVRLLCQRHNLLAARMAYGEKLMRRYRRGIVGPRPTRSPRRTTAVPESGPRSSGREPRAGASPPAR